MKYVPPFGRESEGDSAQYINGDPTVGRQGSIPPAAVFENPQREIVSVITRSRMTPTDADLQQLTKAIRSQALNYVEDTGSDSNLSVALEPALTSYTKGLMLRVLVRHTNTSDVVRINAGAGNVFVRKMTGADVGAEQLPAGGIATLVFDGTNFQLTNFGGAGGGPGDVFRVYIPYGVDHSTTPGIVKVWFSPPFSAEPSAGEVIAVKIANTNPGPITIEVDNLQVKAMLPNGGGGGQALQGDIHTGDVLVLFYDGTSWWFTPNPEIDAPVTYTIGTNPNQQFLSVNDALAALKRKTIGANGFVTLRLITGGGSLASGEYLPISVDHPSGDRLAIIGTLINPVPERDTWVRTVNRAQDAVTNNAIARSRYGTIIRVVGTGATDFGIENTGPGTVQFRDLLIIGNQIPSSPGGHVAYQRGVINSTGHSISCRNITVFGCGVGYENQGAMWCQNCHAISSMRLGFSMGGSTNWLQWCGSHGSRESVNVCGGFAVTFGNSFFSECWAEANAMYGFYADNGSACIAWWSNFLNNGVVDVTATFGASITLCYPPGSWGNLSPPANTVGNIGAVISVVNNPKPP